MRQLTLDHLESWAPLTAERWSDIEYLFGNRGAVGGCWCMDRRLPRGVFLDGRGSENRRKLQELARRSPPPGLIGYVGGEPVGWVAVGPRSEYPVLDRSPIASGVSPVADWVVACLFVRKSERRRGIGRDLIRSATTYASDAGAAMMDGFPVDRDPHSVDVFAFTGTVQQFADVGYREVARPRPSRPIMRWTNG